MPRKNQKDTGGKKGDKAKPREQRRSASRSPSPQVTAQPRRRVAAPETSAAPPLSPSENAQEEEKKRKKDEQRAKKAEYDRRRRERILGNPDSAAEFRKKEVERVMRWREDNPEKWEAEKEVNRKARHDQWIETKNDPVKHEKEKEKRRAQNKKKREEKGAADGLQSLREQNESTRPDPPQEPHEYPAAPQQTNTPQQPQYASDNRSSQQQFPVDRRAYQSHASNLPGYTLSGQYYQTSGSDEPLVRPRPSGSTSARPGAQTGSANQNPPAESSSTRSAPRTSIAPQHQTQSTAPTRTTGPAQPTHQVAMAPSLELQASARREALQRLAENPHDPGTMDWHNYEMRTSVNRAREALQRLQREEAGRGRQLEPNDKHDRGPSKRGRK